MNVKIIIICLSLMVLNVPDIAFSADQLNTFTFQGRLTNAESSPISSTLNMTFRIYGNQNNCLWSESKAVSVVAGGIHLILGTSSSNPIPLTVNEEARYIGLAVGSDPEMEPRQEIGGVLRAGFALSVTNAAITTSKLADLAVTEDKIADGALTSAKIANSSVTSNKIAISAVTADKLSNNVLTAEKLSASGETPLGTGTAGQLLLSGGDGTFNWGNVDTDINMATTSTHITLTSEQSGMILVSGNSTVSLPAPSSAQGKRFTIKKTDTSSTTVTISGDIEGESNPQLSEQYAYMSIISNGSEWLKIAESISTSTASVPQTYVSNSLGMTFRLIPAGTFVMGSPSDELGRDGAETQYTVTLTESFYMQTTEVTQGQWKAVMGNNPSNFDSCGLNCPVEYISWDDCQTFIATLNAMGEGAYTLPTEAQWEYAARAGSNKAFANGVISNTTTDSNLDIMGWYVSNSNSTPHAVAQKQANAWGLFDMHGNVWEWCNDWHDTYPTGSVTDPGGPSSGTHRVDRGGSWSHNAQYCRSANRGYVTPGNRYSYLGLRLSRTIEP
ncbi:Sulphatase-modifying factor domain protein [Candidatus Magnetomorum sp. HK-1]|nr:Sulphatase-modifying factor domain protein [Candidatus Magnetomorum sp. HK-1]